MLINPTSNNDDDNPAKHLEIDITTGLMIPLTERGKMCIDIFGLNVRDNLVQERRSAICRVQILLTKMNFGNAPEALDELKDIYAGKCSYSLAQSTVVDKSLSSLLEITS